MPRILRVEIPWVQLRQDREPLWQANLCLYAYLHPERDWLLYIGKADLQTVRQRLHGDHKDALFDFFWERYGIDEVRVLQGDLVLEDGRHRSAQLLADVETLLIIRLQPPGNVANTRSRTFRPGLRVRCTGEWPFRRAGFHDWD
jgi:hypothetical protein